MCGQRSAMEYIIAEDGSQADQSRRGLLEGFKEQPSSHYIHQLSCDMLMKQNVLPPSFHHSLHTLTVTLSQPVNYILSIRQMFLPCQSRRYRCKDRSLAVSTTRHKYDTHLLLRPLVIIVFTAELISTTTVVEVLEHSYNLHPSPHGSSFMMVLTYLCTNVITL